MSFETFTPPATRQYIPECTAEIITAYRDGMSKFAADIPPRSGKSNIIYQVATEMTTVEGCPFVLVLSPWVFLREQVCNPNKIDDHIAIYGVKQNIVTSEICSFQNYRFWDIEDTNSRPILWSASLSMAYNQITNLKMAIQHAKETTGVSPIVVFDEAHILGDQKMMGAVYDELFGQAFLISLTGTFYRRDKKPIKGANIIEIDSKTDVKQTIRRRISPEQVKEVDYKGNTRTYEMTPDYRFTWRQAWGEGTLAKIDGLWVGHEVDGQDISTLKKKDILPGTLRQVIESPACVAEFARHMVHEVGKAKAYKPPVTDRAAGMVIVGTDIADKNGEKEANRHAKQVRDALIKQAKAEGHHDWQIEIVTMADNGETAKGADKLEAFRDNNKYDIIIVKMMGLVGLDVKRLKVLALLSTLREGPMLGQALTRPLTIWPEAKGLVPQIIMLKDPFMRDSFNQMVTQQGGEAKTSDLSQEDERIIDEPKVDQNQDIGDTTGVVGHINNNTSELEGDFIAIVEAIRRKFPNATDGKDAVEIIAGHKEGAYPVDQTEIQAAAMPVPEEKPHAIKLDEKLAAQCAVFNDYTKDYANLVYSYAAQQQDWVMARTEIARTAKAMAGIAVEIGYERDLSKLERANEFLQGRIREISLERA